MKLSSELQQKYVHEAWAAVRDSLDIFFLRIRELDGCENTVITLCISNGSHMNVFTIPHGANLFGRSATNTTDTGRQQRLKGEGKMMPKTVALEPISSIADLEHSQLPSFSLDVLRSVNMKELRLFFTSLRKKLKINTFAWPASARLNYQKLTTKPVPAGPGRAGSKKEDLILMLELSLQADEKWNRCIRQGIDGYRKTNSNQESPSQEEISRKGPSKGDGINFFVNESNKKQSNFEESVRKDVLIHSLGNEASIIAKSLPRDGLIANPKNCWLTLTQLLGALSYPSVACNSGWFIQRTPADGNCLFSAVMTTARLRDVLPRKAESVQSLRALLKANLEQLANAGREGSPFRRDWLGSCVYEVDNQRFEELCSTALGMAIQSSSEDDIESFLGPLRLFVSNWAKNVGNSHWGGLLRVELCILASITVSVIEILGIVDSDAQGMSPDVIQMCDTRNGNETVSVKRRDLIFPVGTTLPSLNERFLSPVNAGDTKRGWIGPYPVLRILLSDRHYSACTSRYSYPISGETTMNPEDRWVKDSKTLVEPYASLSEAEMELYLTADNLIKNWSLARRESVEQGRYADSVVFQSNSTAVSVSSLSHLQVPGEELSLSNTSNFMLSDDIVTSYMHLLERRNERLLEVARSKGLNGPPKARYMDSWFYKTIARGLTGPSARRKRDDLLCFNRIILPALQNGHWCLAVCYMDDGVIGVFDPMGFPRYDIFTVIKTWVEAQLRIEKNTSWEFMHLRESRGCTQIGNVDCGIYVCKAAESVGMGYPIRISQWDIGYVRKRMIVEFMKQEATELTWRGTTYHKTC